MICEEIEVVAQFLFASHTRDMDEEGTTMEELLACTKICPPFHRAWSPSFVDYVPRAAITYDQAGRRLAKERKLEVGALVVSLTSCSWLCLLDSWLFWNPSLNPRASCLFPKPPLFVGELWPWNSISIWRRMNR
jgi:hypothetical protein